MDNYTRKFFFEAIERILDEREIEEVRPVFLFRSKDGLITLLDRSGNKAVGEIERLVWSILGNPKGAGE